MIRHWQMISLAMVLVSCTPGGGSSPGPTPEPPSGLLPAPLPAPFDPGIISCATPPHPFSHDDAKAPSVVLHWPLENAGAPNVFTKPNRLISQFGPRFKETVYDFHQGIDLVPEQIGGGPYNHVVGNEPEVHAAILGLVIEVNTKCTYPSANDTSNFTSCKPGGGSGNFVRLRHRLDGMDPTMAGSEAEFYYTSYLHLASVNVVKDQVVTQNQVIGLLGDTGAKTPHVHFEVRSRNSQFYALNPWRFLPHPHAKPQKPSILLSLNDGSCIKSLPEDPIKFWVKYTAPRHDIDVNEIQVTVTDRYNGCKSTQRIVNYECRKGITKWDDKSGCTTGDGCACTSEIDDGIITCSGNVGNTEYDAEATDKAAFPLFQQCGGPPRNLFNNQSQSFALEFQFLSGLKMSSNARIDAKVCAVNGDCTSATSVLTNSTSDVCRCDSDCKAVQCCNTCVTGERYKEDDAICKELGIVNGPLCGKASPICESQVVPVCVLGKCKAKASFP